MTFENSKVVITGGAGFIGINLANSLSETGAEVIVIDLPSKDFSGLSDGITICKGDIMDQEFLNVTLRDANYVFHLAAKTDLSGTTIDSYKVNFDGTENVIEAIRENKKICKFIFFSTQLVVGIFNETRFINQYEPYRTKTLYGESKIIGEKIVKDKCSQHEIPYIIFRPTSVFGPYGKEPYREFFLTIKKRQYFHIGKANNLVSMVYVKNLVDQILFLAKIETNETTFFGNDIYPYTMREFCDEIGKFYNFKIPTIPYFITFLAAYCLGFFKILGINVPLYPFRLRNILANYCYDIGNSLKLGFFPKYDMRKSINETLEWYEKNDPAFKSVQ